MESVFCILIFVVCHFGILLRNVDAKQGLTLEYCISETFLPNCEDDEVITMENAMYGQMKVGKCLDQNYGYLGCSANILGQMDQKCSGMTSCSVIISSIVAELNCSIPVAFSRFLEAKYSCKKVMELIPGKCEMKLKSGRQSLAFTDSFGNDCGGENNPLIIQAKSGQKINVTLTDFNWNAIHESLIGCVQRYGYMIDVDEVVDICGKTSRQKPVLLSKGSTLQIVMNKNTLQDVKFLLHFEVSGCPTYESPPDTRMEESNGVLTIWCIHNHKNWKMRCIGNHWIGIVGKCEKAKETKSDQKSVEENDNTVFGMPPVVGFSLIGGIFLVILCVMVTVVLGFFCIRKSKPSDNKGYFLPPVTSTYNPTITTLPLLPTQRSGTIRSTVGITGDNTISVNRGHNVHVQNNSTSPPQYFVLENPDDGKKEPIYDAVYQNIPDLNSM